MRHLSSMRSILLGAVMGTSLSAVSAAPQILHRLEKGEVVASKVGSSFDVQTLAGGDSTGIVQALTTDITQIPKYFPNIAFVRPYRTSNGTLLAYIKVRGLGDGMGLLMRVITANQAAFANAREFDLDKNAYDLGVGAVSPSVYPGLTTVNEEVAAMNIANTPKTSSTGGYTVAYPTVGRSLYPLAQIALEGPLNEQETFPGLRVALSFAVSSYSINDTVKGENKMNTHIYAHLNFLKKGAKRSLGDYRGFGDAKLGLAERVGLSYLNVLRSSFNLANGGVK